MKEREDFFIVVRLESISKVVEHLMQQKYVGFDIETCPRPQYKNVPWAGLHPTTGDIRLLSFSDGKYSYIIDTFYVSDFYDIIRPLFEAPEGPFIVGAHIDFDLMFLQSKGIKPYPKRILDVSDAYKLYRESPGNLSSKLIDIAAHFNYGISKEQQGSDWSRKPLFAKQYEYSAIDSYIVVQLMNKLEPELARKGMRTITRIEGAAAAPVSYMRLTGIHVDLDFWNQYNKEIEQKIQHTIDELRQIAKARGVLFKFDTSNLNSSYQAKVLLNQMNIKAENTSEDYLRENFYHDEFVKKFLEYRTLNKLYTSFGPQFIEQYCKNGKIYPSWYKFETVTARMSCRAPNLQQIPRGDIRKAFIPAPGKVMIKADYSQIELRLAAIVASEYTLLDKYAALEDVHAYTASQLYDIPVSEVTKQQRSVGKAVNFALLYGMGTNSLKRRLKIELGIDYDYDEVEDIRNTFFKTYSQLRKWHREVSKELELFGYVSNLNNRRRKLDENQFTAAVNFPVQSLAAEGQKVALTMMYNEMIKRPEMGISLLLAVHDEIVIEVFPSYAEEAKKLLVDCMSEAMRYVCRNAYLRQSIEVPNDVLVEAKICRNWAGDSI